MKSPPVRVVQELAYLRCLVGYLGEKKQKGWWDCGFLDQTGIRFLETTFPRTARSAAAHSTGEAAGMIHDAAIGRLGTFHLFRFPLAVEDRVRAEQKQFDGSSPFSFVSMEQALEKLAAYTDTPLQAPQGPVQIGTEKHISSVNSLAELAAHYHSAFTGGFRCFPYFSASHAAR